MNKKNYYKIVPGLIVAFSIISLTLFYKNGHTFFRRREVTARTDPAIPKDFEPAYLKLHKSGELQARAEKLWNLMESCSLCPRTCGVNRIKGQTGFCGAPGQRLFVASAQLHFGEERPLVGRGGSGTIFFTHCSLKCDFCQNWNISHEGRGSSRSIEDLADMMLDLQNRGCHNINVVTPSHYIAHIVKALDIAAGKGLRLPVIYNTSSYDSIEVIKLLDGIIDIYLPDFKYWDGEMAKKYSAGASDYPEVTKEVILEMQRQVGIAKPAEDGNIYRGLMIRVLVMPDKVSGSEEVVEWISEYLPKKTYVNIMAQYSPQFRAYNHKQISRRITAEEYASVVNRAHEVGLTNLDTRGFRWFR